MKSRRTRFSRAQIAVAVAALLAVQSVRADDISGVPVVVNPRQGLTPVQITLPTGSLNANYIYENDTDKQPGTPKTISQESSFQETLQAQTNGNVFNPDFLRFSAGGLIGLEQDVYTGTDGDQSGNDVLDGWDVSATALGASSAPLTAFTRRNESDINPSFSPTLRDTNTTYGASTNIQNPYAPTQITYTHEDDLQTETGGITEYLLHQDSATWHTNFVTLPNQSLTFDYDYQNTDTQEQESPDEKYQINDLNLNHVANLGPSLADSLASSVSETDQTGFLGYEEEHVDETLRIQNTEALQTHLQYTLDNTRTNGIQQTSNRLDGGFVHHLYESLVTSGDVGGQVFDEEDANIGDAFGHLNFAYHKTVPFGLLLSNLNLGYEYQHQSNGNDETAVLNQPETFTDDTPVILNQQNVDIHSIKVFSSGVLYREGSDYQVARLGNLVEIQPLPGGRIPFGGSTLVDYDLLPQPSDTVNTEDLAAGLRYQVSEGLLSGLAPYIRYGLQQQSIGGESDDENEIIPETYHDLTYGSDYQIWKLIFNVEREQHQSTLVPYNANRYSVRYVDQPGLDTTLSIQATYQTTDYYDEDDTADDTTVSASVTRRLNTQATITGSVIYLNDRDHLFGNTEGLEEQLELDVHYRLFDLFVRGRNSFLNGDEDDGTFQTFEIGVKRSF
ncbi:MAG TPA: hypothetical protein VL992_11180 [Tepidisphaeraceae bacterium]|nr:hypothetical protein [Tepidisphaeraceae bacterium]